MKNKSIFLILFLLCYIFLSISIDVMADDSNEKEIGVLWIEDYSEARAAGYSLSDLQYTEEEAEAFYNWIIIYDPTVYRSFIFGNADAMERYFESASGIIEKVDTVDLVYFTGHGGVSSIWFGTDTDRDGIYPFRVVPEEANWGETDIEWIAFSACLTLYNPTDWNRVFKGLHGILGFSTITPDSPNLGYEFAYYLGSPTPVYYAWRYATIYAEPSDVTGAAYVAIIRIDTTTQDYTNEFFGDSWVDYGSNYVYLYGFNNITWGC